MAFKITKLFLILYLHAVGLLQKHGSYEKNGQVIRRTFNFENLYRNINLNEATTINKVLVLTPVALFLLAYAILMFSYTMADFGVTWVEKKYFGKKRLVKIERNCYLRMLSGKLLKYPLTTTTLQLFNVLETYYNVDKKQAVLVSNGRYLLWNSNQLSYHNVRANDILEVGFRLSGGAKSQQEESLEYEKIVTSKELLKNYVHKELPNYNIESVRGDGLCILHSFKIALKTMLKKDVTIDELLESLRSEILSRYDFYKDFSSETRNILQELNNFLKNPLQYFNTDTGDIFLIALGNSYNVNPVIYQSNEKTCWITNFENKEKEYLATLYFARSLSIHLEPVIPIRSGETSDLDSSIEFIDYVPGYISSSTSTKEIKREVTDESDKIEKTLKEPVERVKASAENHEQICYSSSETGDERAYENDSLSYCSSLDNFDDEEIESSEIELIYDSSTYKTLGKNIWENTPIENVDKIPYDINGLCAYSVTAKSRSLVLDKTKDGRPWKRDSRTKWSNYDTVRYKNCSGGFKCPNIDCYFLKQFGYENQIKFDKKKTCTLCGAFGIQVDCDARKYIAISSNTAHIFHYGTHACVAISQTERVTDLVNNSLKIDPQIKPSTIQGNAILSAMRGRKSWTEIDKTVQTVINKKSISNEKIKQKHKMNPLGGEYEAVKEYKKFLDEKDKLFVYSINENKQYIFKTSTAKMKIANRMNKRKENLLSTEFCCFDGKFKRTKDFVTLTASTYHPLLQKQIPLAIMECKSEDTNNVANFWKEFNNAFKEANDCEDRFTPVGWISDMAAANFKGLALVYGEDIIESIKGCEFHYKKSVNKYAKELGDKEEKFKKLAEDLLVASTPESYNSAYKDIKEFIEGAEELNKLSTWLQWWNDRSRNIFRAFTGYNCPRANQAEVVHASWTNRNQHGLTLLETAEFDARDSLVLEADFDAYTSSKQSNGRGPSLSNFLDRSRKREIAAAEKKGQDLLDHGVVNNPSKTSKNVAHFSNSEEGCNPPKKSKPDNSEKLLKKRMEAAESSASIMKIRKHKIHSKLRREYSVCNSAASRKCSVVIISNICSCTCVDYKNNGNRTLCKHILFVIIHVLSGSDQSMTLKNRDFTDNYLLTLFTAAGNNIASKFEQEKPKKRKRKEFEDILKSNENFGKEQVWTLHLKEARSATCSSSSCKKVIQRGVECFAVDGALTIPFNKSKAVPQKFYFCVDSSCFNNNPPWTSLRKPTCFFTKNIEASRKDTIATNLDLQAK